MKDNLNAKVYIKEGKENYTNLFVEFKDKEGNNITLLVKPICKEKKTLAKLMYKIKVALGE